MIMNSDVIVEVRFKTSEEGGRQTPIVGNSYSCPLFVDGEGFDCRILIGNKTLELGEWYRLPLKFLNRDLVIAKLSLGKQVSLWEGKEVANGKVIEVLAST